MGINDNIVEDYRNVVTNAILNSPTIVEVLSRNTLTVENSDELLWNHVIPQQYLPMTETDTETYIFYDLNEDVIEDNKMYIDVTLVFWVVSHKGNVKYKSRLKNDILVTELRKIFGLGNVELGISNNKLIYNRILDTGSKDHTGRVLTFRIVDWKDKIRWDNK